MSNRLMPRCNFCGQKIGPLIVVATPHGLICSACVVVAVDLVFDKLVGLAVKNAAETAAGEA